MIREITMTGWNLKEMEKQKLRLKKRLEAIPRIEEVEANYQQMYGEVMPELVNFIRNLYASGRDYKVKKQAEAYLKSRRKKWGYKKELTGKVMEPLIDMADLTVREELGLSIPLDCEADYERGERENHHFFSGIY